MTQSVSPFPKRAVVLASLGVALIMFVGGAAAASHAIAPSDDAVLAATVHPASGAPEQWAFGGSASVTETCSASSCLGENLTNETFSFSIHYYIEWVVIYTLTNISSTQTQIEGQSAINLSASYDLSVCQNVSEGQPCQTTSIAIGLGGKETANGFTNVTNGTVDLTAGTGSPAEVTALAIMNAASHAALNFSGSYSIQSENVSIGNESASFDVGSSESSAITFSEPLGIVPFNPAPGDDWSANESYTSSGSVTYGYSVSASEDGIPVTESQWNTTAVPGSGTLYENGSDLGAYTLWDNYTHPATTVTAQEILLSFSAGNYSGWDGWILIPDVFYGGLLSSLDESRTVGLPMPAASTPQASTESSSETAYYHEGSGFIGGAEVGNTSIPTGLGSASIHLTAGPEPVSVAQGQYAAITAGPAASKLPWDLIAGVVVVAVVVAAIGLLMWRRSMSRRRPPAPMPPADASAPTSPPNPPLN